jgi:hypothetical protein
MVPITARQTPDRRKFGQCHDNSFEILRLLLFFPAPFLRSFLALRINVLVLWLLEEEVILSQALDRQKVDELSQS